MTHSLSVSRPDFASDLQWQDVVRIKAGGNTLVYVAEFLIADHLQFWYRRDGVLRVRSVDSSGRKVQDRKSRI